MVSLEFFFDNPSGCIMAVSSYRSEYQEYFLGGEGSWYIGLTILPPSYPMVLKSGASTPWNLQGLSKPAQSLLYHYLFFYETGN